MSYDETIVLELNFGRRQICFTVLYRSPAFKFGSPKFEDFLTNFRNLHSKKVKNLSQHSLMEILSFGGRTVMQLPKVGKLSISLPHLIYHKLFPSRQILSMARIPRIDLTVTDQPSLILDSGIRASLDSQRYQQIVR